MLFNAEKNIKKIVEYSCSWTLIKRTEAIANLSDWVLLLECFLHV